VSTAIEERLLRIWEAPKTVHGLFATVDHKIIGKRYLATAMVFLFIGGIEALIMRLQLARPERATRAGDVQPIFHNPRHDDDLLVRLTDSLRFANFLITPDDRSA